MSTKNYKKLLSIPVCGLLVIISALVCTTVELEGIKISPESISFTELNETQDIKCTAVPNNAALGSVELISDNPKIVEAKDRTLTAKAEGSAKVYVKSKDKDIKSNVITVTVIDKKAEQERQKLAQDFIKQIDSIDENNLLQSYDTIKQLDEQLSKADPKVLALVTNKDKFDELRDKCYEQKKQADEAAEAAAKAQAEAEERARAAAEQQAQKAAASQAAASSQATSAPQEPAEQSDNNITVYVGKTGTKYHNKGCPTLKGGGTAISLSTAEARGYTACKVCH